MDRKQFLKLIGGLAILSPLAAIAKWREADKSPPSKSEFVMPPQTHANIDRLFRRLYAGDGPINKEVRREFVTSALWLAMEDFSKIAEFESVGQIKVIFGRKWKVFDESEDAIAKPPYYLWCRCNVDIPLQAIQNKAMMVSLSRNMQGFLPHTYI